MGLTPGTRIGAYEILSPIGAGGMGEVYRARDAKLGRDVAIKILPDQFTNDAERVARFEREARTLASLNHVNIAQIYGLEDRALVMELVEGEDLSVLIARGPVPLHDALAIANQITRALQAAHELSIVHRDLKPANIKVRPDGTVKVLDFGLARAAAAGDARGASGLSDSPTMTSPATELGLILGTAAYMSPEQARGKIVDRRADVWAFGVVLYEMLTGRRAFDGAEVSDVLASILKDAPRWTHLPPDTPLAVRRLLRRCLDKDPANRLDSMAAARLEIGEALAPAVDVQPAPAEGPRRRLALLRNIGVPLATALAGGLLVFGLTRNSQPAASAVPLSFPLTAPGGGGSVGVNVNQPDLAISPDGRHIVYGDGESERSTLVLRSLDRFGDTPFKGLGQQARAPFFSPDGKWLAYFTAVSSGQSAHLMKVPLGGGPSVEITPVRGNLRGASWAADDTIIFATSESGTGLFRVNANGGTAEQLTTPDLKNDEVDHLWPCQLPDGKHALFVIARQAADGTATRDLAALDLTTRTWTVLRKDASFPVYLPTGHLLYASEKGLFALAFDPVTLEIHGAPSLLIDDIAFKPASGAADVAVSTNGTLAYVGGGAYDRNVLVWVDRQGRVVTTDSPPRRYGSARLSPDGQRAAVVLDDSGAPTIWVYDFSHETLMRLTPPTQISYGPVWSGTGREIYFFGGTATESGLSVVPASGTSAPTLLLKNPGSDRFVPTSMGPSPSQIMLEMGAPDGVGKVATAVLGTPTVVTPLFGGTGQEGEAVLSPNGRWLAYSANEGARREIFLRPFPDVAADRIQVSTAGGRNPRWSANGRELFFRDEEAVWVAAIGDAGRDMVGKPARLPLPTTDRLLKSGGTYDVSPDGQRLLQISRLQRADAQNELRVVTNWFEVVKAKLATAK